jgi:acyl-coenzyme A synthetase/AMP-(fatty) acid ligase
LLNDTACSKLIFSSERRKEATDIVAGRAGMKMWEIQPLWELLHGEATQFPFEKKFEDAEHDTAIIIHSSGTTGKLV